MLLRNFLCAFLSAFALQTSRARRPRQPFRANFVVELDVVRASQSRRCCFAAKHALGKTALDQTTGATFARSQEVQPILGAAVTTAVTFLQQRNCCAQATGKPCTHCGIGCGGLKNTAATKKEWRLCHLNLFMYGWMLSGRVSYLKLALPG